jgi:hypothetical protein
VITKIVLVKDVGPEISAMCEQTTSTGTIQMIRKSFDDTIEQFDVDGGNLIDDDGTWSYQIPNLDYVVTNEYGDFNPITRPKCCSD